MIISLALIWLAYKLNRILPLVFLLVTWIPDVVIITGIFSVLIPDSKNINEVKKKMKKNIRRLK